MKLLDMTHTLGVRMVGPVRHSTIITRDDMVRLMNQAVPVEKWLRATGRPCEYYLCDVAVLDTGRMTVRNLSADVEVPMVLTDGIIKGEDGHRDTMNIEFSVNSTTVRLFVEADS